MTGLQHDMDDGALPCCFCGGPEFVDIADIWADGTFQLDACCPDLFDPVIAEMPYPVWARDLLRRLGAEELAGVRLRRVCDGQGSIPVLDCQLEVRPVTFATARDFIARHHGHCAPPRGWRFGASISTGTF